MNPGEAQGVPGARRPATVLESVAELRAQLRQPATVRDHGLGPSASSAPADDTAAFRPSVRPSMATLCVLDDGDESGEIVRIRGDSFVIGRVGGDLVIPHDGGISGRHAELSRRLENGQYRWYLKDLQSTNGTFARASTVVLGPQQELLIGGRRYRFEPPAAPEAAAPEAAPGNATRKWQVPTPGASPTMLFARLVELLPTGDGRVFPLTQPEHWLGRDPRACTIVLDDPMVDRKHARVHRDPKGRWIIENARSRNGLWARITEVALEKGGQFQCGEQRFLIRVL